MMAWRNCDAIKPKGR